MLLNSIKTEVRSEGPAQSPGLLFIQHVPCRSDATREPYGTETVALSVRQPEETSMKRIAIILIASAALCAPALAEEVGVGVGVGPVGVGVTVGSGPDRVVREKEIVREREPRDRDKVIIERDRRPDVVEKKTIIKERDRD